MLPRVQREDSRREDEAFAHLRASEISVSGQSAVNARSFAKDLFGT